MSHIYRCSSCRTRNTFARAVGTYVRPKSCRHCGHQKFYPDKERLNRRACWCYGCHFPHRPGSGCCDRNIDGLRNAMLRAGMDTAQVPASVKAGHGAAA